MKGKGIKGLLEKVSRHKKGRHHSKRKGGRRRSRRRTKR